MSDMKMVKVAELTGPALDWAVGYALDWRVMVWSDSDWDWRGAPSFDGDDTGELMAESDFSPSTDWTDCGPIIEQVGAVVRFGSEWHVYLIDGKAVRSGGFDTTYLDVDSGKDDSDGVGETPLVAVCRAFVSGRVGEQIKIPIELANPL